MFHFTARPAFTAPVEVWEPGATAPQTFTGRFRALTRSETDALQGADVPAAEIPARNREWLEKIFEGWEDDLAVDGAALPVTHANRALLLDADWVRAAVTLAYLRGVSGAARKN